MNSPLVRRDGVLHLEDVSLVTLADEVGTPCYVYSRALIERRFLSYDRSFGDRPHRICFAVKANSNLAVLGLLAGLGAGFDIVSVGELERVLAAGGQARTVVFSGVGKREDEIRRALEAGIGCFNVESEAELARIDRIAGSMGVVAPVSLRVNPDVDARTHPYISTGLKENKFGIDIERAEAVYRQAAERENLRIVGVDCHIGSQLTELQPFEDALDRVLVLVDRLEESGIRLEHLDLGGGLGIRYTDELPPEPTELVAALLKRLEGRPQEILLEPGRSIVGEAGVLLTRVEHVKDNGHRRFCIVDAAMNDLMRPALYDSVMDILPVCMTDAEPQRCEVVGPVCETGDFLGRDRWLAVDEGDLLAIAGAGAYGFTMSSNYNSRPRAAEVMVDKDRFHVVRSRETLEDLWRGEQRLP
ncbi:MAG: diaminopimelate decarboxylase [Halothiobacillaceae bacterium]